MVNFRKFQALLVAVLLGVSGIARADSIFTSLASFDAATASSQTITFTAPSPTTFSSSFPGSSYTDAATGAVFSLPSGQYLNITGKDYYSPQDFSEDFLVGAVSSTGPETIQFASSVTAVALDFGSFSGDPLDITLSNGSSFIVSSPATLGSLAFVGFTSAAPLTSVTISATKAGDPILIGDVVIGQAVPEPSTSFLLAMGLLGLLIVSRRRFGWGTFPCLRA